MMKKQTRVRVYHTFSSVLYYEGWKLMMKLFFFLKQFLRAVNKNYQDAIKGNSNRTRILILKMDLIRTTHKISIERIDSIIMTSV